MSGVPLQEFAKMMREAQAAFESSDMATALEVNERFSQWGYGLIVDSGRLRLENQTTPKQGAISADDRLSRGDGDYTRR